MNTFTTTCFSIVLATLPAFADEPAPESQAKETEAAAAAPAQVDPGAPVKMSGMSILGNEETPKALVIVPWKSSELGDDPGLEGVLDDRARPVDKEVFMRELDYYELRSGQ
jgi:hypothetical protein